jgi:hypothetical protein
MKKKTRVIKKTWMIKAKVEVEVKPVCTLTHVELVLFLFNEHEFSGLTRAIGRNEEERKILWQKTGAKYGFDPAPKVHVLNLVTGEITKAF